MKNNFSIALFLIATLIFSSCKNEEEKLYESSKLANTSKAYKEYIDKYPEGEFLKEITDSFKLREEEDVFTNAKNENSINAYSNYLEKCPDGRFTNEAKDSLYFLNEIKCFQKAKKEMSSELFKMVLDSFPKGRFKNKAIFYLDSLKKMNIKRQLKVGEERIITIEAAIKAYGIGSGDEPQIIVLDYIVPDDRRGMFVEVAPSWSEAQANGTYGKDIKYQDIFNRYYDTKNIDRKYKYVKYRITLKEKRFSDTYISRELIKLAEIK